MLLETATGEMFLWVIASFRKRGILRTPKVTKYILRRNVCTTVIYRSKALCFVIINLVERPPLPA